MFIAYNLFLERFYLSIKFYKIIYKERKKDTKSEFN